MTHAIKNIDVEQPRTLQELAARTLKVSLPFGGAAIVVALLLGLWQGDGLRHFLHAYLLNFCYFLSLALGALFFVILQYLTRAGWSVVVRRLAEFLAAGVIPFSLLFLPILIPVLCGSSALYAWNDAELVRTDELIRGKTPYLNVIFFTGRCLIYFAIWGLLARYFLCQSLEQDETGEPEVTLRLERASAPAMFLFAGTVTFFAFDLLMSLDPHWFSTIFGVYFFAGCVVGCFALLAAMCVVLPGRGWLSASVTVEHQHDIGKLLFGFICFWGYIAFSQYLLIWYANIPEETEWYKVRLSGGWEIVALTILVGHFLLPFFGLMSRGAKRSPRTLLFWAGFLLAMHWIDLYWLVMPALSPESPTFGLVELSLFAGLGALYLSGVLWIAADRPLIPRRDPRLHESLAFHNV